MRRDALRVEKRKEVKEVESNGIVSFDGDGGVSFER